MATIHNPTNFDPAAYEVLDYLDNRRPVFYGSAYDGPAAAAMAAAQHRADVAAWERDMEHALGADWRAKSHRCVHCGQGNVRWITAVQYVSGERLVFGADCTKRLGFTDKMAFKLARLKRLADAQAASLKAHAALEAFLGANPKVVAFRAALEAPAHVGNVFLRDVLAKLAKYGSISERQIEAVEKSLAKDVERATRPAEVKVPAPVGNGITVRGEVVSVKVHDSQFGESLKATIKVTTPEGVWLAWGTVPASLGGEDGGLKGKQVELVANLQAGSDPSFVFFKRPRLAKVLAA